MNNRGNWKLDQERSEVRKDNWVEFKKVENEAN